MLLEERFFSRCSMFPNLDSIWSIFLSLSGKSASVAFQSQSFSSQGRYMRGLRDVLLRRDEDSLPRLLGALSRASRCARPLCRSAVRARPVFVAPDLTHASATVIGNV